MRFTQLVVFSLHFVSNLRLPLFLFIFFSFSAHLQASPVDHCPNLTGTYLCRENSYRKDTLYTFNYQMENGFWRYTMKAHSPEGTPLSLFQFLAHDQEQEVRDQITGQVLSLKASCLNQLLQVKGTFKTPEGKIIFFSEDLSLTETKDLSNVSLDINGQVVKEICQRN